MHNRSVSIAAAVLICALTACSGTDSNSNNGPSGGAAAVGGGTSLGGGVSSGGSQGNGTTSQAGAVGTGGTSSLGTGGTSVVASSHTGGSNGTGGRVNTGGLASTGGALVATGGAKATGGNAPTGGSVSSGGSQTGGKAATGGAAPTGGSTAAGGAFATGGSRATGGASSVGGSKNTGGIANTGGNHATGGTNAGGGSSYNPCANPCKILPFGDSITHGLQSSDAGGYRSQLFKLVVAAGKSITFLGSQSAGPATVSGVTFPKNHEGHDGYTIDSGYSTYGTPGISSLIPSPAFSTIPNIVLLMIGTNDITSTGSAAATASTRLDGLLGKIVAAAPNALIAVAEIPPVGYTSADLTNYNAKIPGIVQARAAQGQHVVLADMSQMPKSDLASDNVHPNDQGYAYIANIWYTAIQNLLP
jgi:lysophospholipase L1-like esterase